MKKISDWGRFQKIRDPEEEARRLKHRFSKVSRRYHRAMKLRRIYYWAKGLVLGLAGAATLVVAIYLGLTRLSPWPAMVTLKHLASFPNCNAARIMGLAPSNRGEPGYWPSHDADGDGKACEPWTR